MNGKYRWFYELGASSDYYKREVQWDFTGVPNNITPIPVAANGVYGVYLDLTNYEVSTQNQDSQLDIRLHVESLLNEQAQVNMTVRIKSVAVTTITLSTSNEVVSSGNPSVVNLSFAPSNQTKSRFAQLVYDTDILDFNSSTNELFVKSGVTEYFLTSVYAKVGSDEYEVVSNTKKLYLNDFTIIYKVSNPGFTNLLSYIKNTLKVSASAE